LLFKALAYDTNDCLSNAEVKGDTLYVPCNESVLIVSLVNTSLLIQGVQSYVKPCIRAVSARLQKKMLVPRRAGIYVCGVLSRGQSGFCQAHM